MDASPSKALHHRYEYGSFDALFLPLFFGSLGLVFGYIAFREYSVGALPKGELILGIILPSAFVGFGIVGMIRALRGAFIGSFVDLDAMTFNLFKGVRRSDPEKVYTSVPLSEIIAVERYQEETEAYIIVSIREDNIRFPVEHIGNTAKWITGLIEIAPHIEHRPDS